MHTTASPAKPIIVCEHVFMAYGHEEVLHDVSLRIPQGAFVPFVGPNGAGKTTLLRVILGFLRPQRGRVITPFQRVPPGYVSQQKSIDPLYPVSARQIVRMGLYPQIGWWRRPSASQEGAVERALHRLGLSGHAHKRYSELSGGMKQKALIARTLAGGADVIVMDEPTSELDEPSEHDVLDHLFRLSHDDGKTVLLTHHGPHPLVERAPLVCHVNHGRVHLAGPGEASDLGDGVAAAHEPPQQERGTAP